MPITVIFAQYICDWKHFYLNRCMAKPMKPFMFQVNTQFLDNLSLVSMFCLSSWVSSINSKELELLFFKILGLHKSKPLSFHVRRKIKVKLLFPIKIAVFHIFATTLIAIRYYIGMILKVK